MLEPASLEPASLEPASLEPASLEPESESLGHRAADAFSPPPPAPLARPLVPAAGALTDRLGYPKGISESSHEARDVADVSRVRRDIRVAGCFPPRRGRSRTVIDRCAPSIAGHAAARKSSRATPARHENSRARRCRGAPRGHSVTGAG